MKKLEFNDIRNKVEQNGYTLISYERVKGKLKLKCLCEVHGYFFIRFDKLSSGQGCKQCYLDSVKYKLKEILDIFYKSNLKPLFKKFNSCKERLPFICNKHPELGVQYTNAEHIKRINTSKNDKKYSCEACRKEHLVKLGLSRRVAKENTLSRRYGKYYDWRNKVLKICNYTCKKCGHSSTNLRVHHVLNFNQFPRFRTTIFNGVVMCRDCHKLFHKKYGRQNNNAKQLKEFLGEYKVGNN